MTIRIKGKIGKTEIDLSIDGLNVDNLGELRGVLNEGQLSAQQSQSAEEAKGSQKNKRPTRGFDSQDSSRQSTGASGQNTLQLAIDKVEQEKSVLSSDLINYLADLGIGDMAIKRALLFMRESGDFLIEPSQDGLQRVYGTKKD